MLRGRRLIPTAALADKPGSAIHGGKRLGRLAAGPAAAHIFAMLAVPAFGLVRYSGYVGCGHPSPERHVCDDVSVRYVNFIDRVGSSTLVRECQTT
jgi:hypothetical protein